MNKLKSRKLWAWIAWGIITAVIIITSPKNIPDVVPWFGAVTAAYLGGQAAVDMMATRKAK
jgi:hypothetical protein